MPQASATLADAYAELVLSLRPFAYYRMERPKDKKDAHVVFDSAAGGHHGTLHFTDEFAGEPWEHGRFGRALYLRGPAAGDYVDIPDFPGTKNNQLSLSVWVYAWATGVWPTIASEHSVETNTHRERAWEQSDGWQFWLGVIDDTKSLELKVNQRNKTSVTLYQYNAKPLSFGQWQHVAFVADGSVCVCTKMASRLPRRPATACAIAHQSNT